MIQLVLRALREWPRWEPAPRWSLIMGLVACAGCLLLIAAGPAELRLAALIGAFGALIVVQASILVANRHLVNDHRRAQDLFLQGDYAGAVALLEPLRKSGKARWRELTLLANALRYLGHHEEAAEVVQAALIFAPDYHYPQFTLGRILLESGRYSEAAEALARAMAGGAPLETTLDLAEARWRAGDTDGAKAALANLLSDEDPARRLMAAFLCWQLGGTPPLAEVTAAGLPGWNVLEARTAHTPYGAALGQDRAALEALHS